jgi:CheY-like chemotaxis protein/CHASE3 domain sensor protein
MNLTLGKKIVIGFIACAMTLLGVAIFAFNNSEKFIRSTAMINHSNVVMYEFQQILVSSLDAATGTRGFVITGNNAFLETFSSDVMKGNEHLEKVKELTKDNPAQQKNIAELKKTIEMRFTNLKRITALRQQNFEKARELVILEEGKQLEDQIRKTIDSAQSAELLLLAQRKQINEKDAHTFKLVFAVLLLLILLVLVIIFSLIINNLRALKIAEAETVSKNWFLSGNTELSQKLIGVQRIEELANNSINFLCSYLKATIGAVYIFNDKDNSLILRGQYAFFSPKDTRGKFAMNEGLIGQVAQEQKTVSLTDIPDEHICIRSTFMDAKPKHLLVTPCIFEGKTLGVIEIGSLKEFNKIEMEFINVSMDIIGISVNSALDRKQILELLEETQIQSDEKEKRAAELVIANKELAFQNQEKEKRAAELALANNELASQAEELQLQQEELKQMNEELEEQAQNLIQQQEELQVSNEELEEQTLSLEEKNEEIEAAKTDIEQKTKQLEISSKYKSEFLANMSHELRTPLNSLLILSKDLSENRKKNLDAIQVESAEIIYRSGHDLLALINKVLDLSKIEAGKMSINIETVSLEDLADELIINFKHQAIQKGLQLTCQLGEGLPKHIRTDAQRLNQILKNLLSNAIKFTEKGSVSIRITPNTESTLSISVADTGVGIHDDKQMAIFEAFQQADGGTSRKYGGTGLGLSISRELAKLLGAEIKVRSMIDAGSTFTVIIPYELKTGIEPASASSGTQSTPQKHGSAKESKYLNYPSIADDRNNLLKTDIVVLIIEDDENFASILLKQANEKGFKCLTSATGEDGLKLVAKYKPQAIILDMGLPGMDGHQVLNELKANPSIRHIPVHIMSANERSLETIKEGAIEYLMKPVNRNELEEAFNRIENFVSRKIKNLLIIEDDENSRKAMLMLIGNGDVKCFEAATGKDALSIYQKNHIDCMILDIGLPDMTGFDLIRKLEMVKEHQIPPIIVYTGKELSIEENHELQKYAESIIIKGVKSEERLLDESALFLHRTISNLPKSKQLVINSLYDKETLFHSKKILLVDDDVRNVFALSKILNERGMEIIKAVNGVKALEMLEKHADIDLVLMDIMMPVMDGYEAMTQIRAQRKWKKLPIIALTAKAMKDDKQKCINAGANDYITKPIDAERLFSLMRVWLSN